MKSVADPGDLEERQRRFVDLRADRPASVWRQRSVTADGRVPAMPPSSLRAEPLRERIASAGAVLVPGLLSSELASELRSDAEHVLAALERVGPNGDSGDEWYRPFAGVAPTPELPLSRQIATLSTMGALLVDAPRFCRKYLSLLDRAGMIALVSEYLGGPAMLSAEKSVIRRVPADTGTNWHQDGAFLGADVSALNLWITLSDCGVDAPGLEWVPARPDAVLSTGTGDALFDWSIGQDEVDLWRGGLPVESPAFAAGDAVLFDHLLVHRTGVRAGMTRERFALETWFFTPWDFPVGYTGIAAGAKD